MMPNAHLLAANAVLLLHFAFVSFVLGGQALVLLGWWRGWAWTRRRAWRWVHLFAIGIVTLQTWLGMDCPLTTLENSLRAQGGALPYANGCITYWVQRLMFYHAPTWVFSVIYSAFAALVIVSFVRYPPQPNPGCKPGPNDAK